MNGNLFFVSSVFDLKSLLFEATVCGMSSSLIHVTVVPASSRRCVVEPKVGGRFAPVSAACADAPGNVTAAARMATANERCRCYFRLLSSSGFPASALERAGQ